MQVYYLQRFWFGNFYSNLNFPQTHYFTIAFDSPVTVKGQIFLNLLSQGFDLGANVVGLAVACVKSYSYLDDHGVQQVVDFTGQDPFGSIFVSNITSVTWELIVTKAWAGAHGMIYYIQ